MRMFAKVNKKRIDMQIEIENLVRNEVARQLAEAGLIRQNEEKNEKRTAAGQKELADYLVASVPTINRWQAEGKLNGCFTRIGRKIIYDLDKVDSKFAG
jgi:hypothetical protein